MPSLEEAHGKPVDSVHRLGKRVVIGLQPDCFLVIHLMVAGRFWWLEPNAKLPGKIGLEGIHFPNGTLLLVNAGTKRRASIPLAQGKSELAVFDVQGLEVSDADLSEFGNAYSDEILHRAKLSPIAQTQKPNAEEIERLFDAMRVILVGWTKRLHADSGGNSRKKSPPSAPTWRSMAALVCLARSAPARFNGLSTPKTKPTIAPATRVAA